MNCKILVLALVAMIGSVGCGSRHESKGNTATLEELNRAVDMIAMQSGRFPPDTNQVVKFLTAWGKSMTEVPPGKSLVLDSKTRHYVLTAAP